jgi:hypothetical protein
VNAAEGVAEGDNQSRQQLLILTIYKRHLSTAHQSYFAMSTDLLPSGVYYIRNEEKFAGRSLPEDKSLLPKRVLCPSDTPEGRLASNLYSMSATRSDLFNLSSVET